MSGNISAANPSTFSDRIQQATKAGDLGAAAATATGALVLLASFFNFLEYNEYPLLSPEVGMIAGLLMVVAGLVGLVYMLADRPGRIALQILLVFLALDLNFDGMIVGIGTAAIVILLNRHMMLFISVIAVVVLAGAVAGSAFTTGGNSQVIEPVSSRSSDAPVLLHLILDEHIGVEGLLGDTPRPTAMRKELTDFYLGNGFRLFGGAYSEYFHTVNSIPQLLNFGVQQEWPDTSPAGMAVSNNAYFEKLREIGYRIAVYQTDFMTFCGDIEPGRCHEYRQQDFAAIAKANLRAEERAQLLTYGFLYLSRFVRDSATYFDRASETIWPRHAGPWIDLESDRRIDSIGAVKVIDQLTIDLSEAWPGDAFFAHLIIPHDPYALRGDCSIKPISEWLVRRSAQVTREQTEHAYFEQIRCLNTKLEEILQALESSEAGKDAVIIVHGDHGFRDAWIEPITENIGYFSDTDLVRGHSTLFAIRAPGIQPGYDAQRVPVSRLLKALAMSGFQNHDVPRDFKHSVVLGNQDWHAVDHYPLPDWWIQGGLQPPEASNR